MAKLEIRLVKGVIAEPERTRRTVYSRGLKKLQQKVSHEVNAALLGKLERVKHLVEISET